MRAGAAWAVLAETRRILREALAAAYQWVVFVGAHEGLHADAEARGLADPALIEYRERERLPTAAFGPPVISAEGRYPWVFDYTSRTRQRHLVLILRRLDWARGARPAGGVGAQHCTCQRKLGC
jgi:hypothetical protein